MPVTSLLQERKLRYAVSPGKNKTQHLCKGFGGGKGAYHPSLTNSCIYHVTKTLVNMGTVPA